jgi:hypothetical protein
MRLKEIDLPSNKQFGYFFGIIFGIVAAFFFGVDSLSQGFVFGVISVLFFLITVIKADLLLPLNKLWMSFGLILGIIISPIILGLIFFGLFTPVAFMMRLFGRDELRLKIRGQGTYWYPRCMEINSSSFKNQF